MWKIGVVTAGGDAPGMNAIIRSIVRARKKRKDLDVSRYRLTEILFS